ncbi:putative RNA-binding protein [Emericellopsis atlantica]|uniref:RNA-binding protein n=1 Tax=Emericellopsis atlantica TaxID=2614577 RepID=A0A9P7ZFI4_9HYPO|nr:putative RNA-binding protein [Emericellopsis atlantica]KAG9250518.1 putative RNA-binding protein [Emericellopsis atlantica]
MTEHPEAEIQASAASLSPVSPSPLHTASPLVVPTLQDTVDTIDAMVAAAAATNGQVAVADLNTSSVPETQEHKAGAHDAADEDVVDDDDDPYGDEAAEELANNTAPAQAQPAQDDGNDDDYANTFDSPINPEEGAEDEQQPEDVARAQHQGDLGAHKPVPKDTQSRDVSASAEKAEHEAAQTSNEQPTAADVAIDQLVADITAQQHPTTSTTTSHDNPTAPAPTETEQQDSQPSMPTSAALPSAASLPPRPPQPAAPGNSLPSQHHPGAPAPATEDQEPAAEAPATGTTSEDDYQRNWERFLADERQYMTEAQWDRFPEGSRIFIGNLSSDKVSKRDVFDIFYRFGRLAQISLKSAYGFVQYHTVQEGSSALQHLEGYEVKGRRIHLEISKLQDKGKKNDRRSPDRDRGGRDSRRNGRHENRGRNHSPRRGNYSDGYGRDGGYGDRRNRSRSPEYGRHGNAHRQRSPMGYGHRSSGSGPDMPQRRFGPDVPDVQLLLSPGLNPDFIAWVEQPFKDKGLAVKSMYIDPRAGGKDQIIQQQAADGVHAVIELDMRAQNMGKVPALAFDRSNGNANVRFDQYADLEPHVVAAVVLDKKSSHARQGYQPPPYAAPQGYGQQPYVGHQPQPQQPPPAAGNYYGAPPQAYPAQPHAFPPQAPAHQAAPSQGDLAAIMGKLDPATLQQVIAAASGSGPGSTDVGAILGALNSQQQAHHPQAPQHAHYQTQLPPQQQYGAPYGGQSAQSGDSAAQVQNIMAQLAKYR